MGRVTTRRRIRRLAGLGGARSESLGYRDRIDTLAVEEPLELRIGGLPYMVTMRTPGHDVELAAGVLLSEGVIHAGEEIHTAMHCGGPGTGGHENTYNVLDLTLTVPAPKPRNFVTTSACGVCGVESIDHIHRESRYNLRDDVDQLDPRVFASLPALLLRYQDQFERTGGTHAAGLFTYTGTPLVVREDVGRHNAVDKVLGWALLEGRLPLRATILQVSGRASFEIVQKALMAGVPVVGAVSAPSSLSVDLAEESGMTLAGFMRGTTMNVYTGGFRLGDHGD